MPQKCISRPLAPSIATADTWSDYQHRPHLHHSHSSAFLFPLSFLHRTLQPLQPFQDNLLCPTLKAFSGILFLEEIKVKCLSITCFQPHFSLFIFQDAPLPWVHHPHRRHHLCALCPCISTCILC